MVGWVPCAFVVFLHPNSLLRNFLSVAECQFIVKGDGCGMYSKMFFDGLYQLIAVGKVTNAKKGLTKGSRSLTLQQERVSGTGAWMTTR